MIDFTKRQLEQLAHSFVEKYYNVLRKRGFKKVERIEPSIMLREVIGVDIQYHTLSPDYSILGYTIGGRIEMEVFDNGYPESLTLDGNTVFIESKLRQMNKGRENFTVMHEGAHQVFFKTFPGQYNSGVRVLRNTIHGEYSAEESQADYLASAMLMPREIVVSGLERYYRKKQNGHYLAFGNESFKRLADHLGVSKQALGIRFRELGIVVDSPHALVIEYSD